MPLQSDLLKGDSQLQSCLTNDASHLVEGTVGSHVSKLQTALLVVDGLGIQPDEIKSKHYGRSTADAVLAFKTKRRIINRAYQTQPDNIVGKMTIAALDRELLKKQPSGAEPEPDYCANDHKHSAHGGANLILGVAVTLTSAPLVAGSVGSGSSSPAAVAKTRAPGGIAAVMKARNTMSRLLAFHRQPLIPPPRQTLVDFDALWKNFGMPTFPLNNPLTGGQVFDVENYLLVVDKVLEGMATNLGQALTLFRDRPEPWYPDAFAFTLSRTRASADPPLSGKWPDGMYFNPGYLNNGQQIGPLKQTEIAIHECAHFVNNDTIQDPVPERLSSAYGYSGFVLHCAFGRPAPFSDTE